MMHGFKVWDSKNKCFYDAEENYFYLSGKGELFEFEYDNPMIKSELHYLPVFSTGKTDKNGVELFDGDIIRSFDNNMIYEIRFHRACWCVYQHAFDSHYTMFDFLSKDSDERYQCEKIGTKFENPDLMETK